MTVEGTKHRGSEFPSHSPEEKNRVLGANSQERTSPRATRQQIDPYGTPAWNARGPQLRGVEANTSGRASQTPTPRGNSATPVPTEAPRPHTANDVPLPEPYGYTKGRPGQGTMIPVEKTFPSVLE